MEPEYREVITTDGLSRCFNKFSPLVPQEIYRDQRRELAHTLILELSWSKPLNSYRTVNYGCYQQLVVVILESLCYLWNSSLLAVEIIEPLGINTVTSLL